MYTERVAQTLAHYDVDVVETSHVHTLWNTLVRVRTSDGGDFALRLCNPLVQNRQLIEQELVFLEFVANGFIHADLHPGNFIANGDVNDLALLDFDQLGRGHFAFDLANLRIELLGEPASGKALWAEAKMGYRGISPLPFADEAALEPFIAAVELAFLDWYYTSPNPDVRLRHERRFSSAWATLASSG